MLPTRTPFKETAIRLRDAIDLLGQLLHLPLLTTGELSRIGLVAVDLRRPGRANLSVGEPSHLRAKWIRHEPPPVKRVGKLPVSS
jgi:hypothetical protein